MGAVASSCHAKKDFNFYLKDQNGTPIPEAAYEITLSDMSTRSGNLDREGHGIVEDCPDGPFEIHYLDLDDVKAKSLAARAHVACQSSDVNEIHSVLSYSPELLQAVVSAYQQYFNDISGSGFEQDIQKAVSDEGEKLAIQLLLTRAGLSSEKSILLTKFDEIDGSPAPYLDYPPPAAGARS